MISWRLVFISVGDGLEAAWADILDVLFWWQAHFCPLVDFILYLISACFILLGTSIQTHRLRWCKQLGHPCLLLFAATNKSHFLLNHMAKYKKKTNNSWTYTKIIQKQPVFQYVTVSKSNVLPDMSTKRLFRTQRTFVGLNVPQTQSDICLPRCMPAALCSEEHWGESTLKAAMMSPLWSLLCCVVPYFWPGVTEGRPECLPARCQEEQRPASIN